MAAEQCLMTSKKAQTVMGRVMLVLKDKNHALLLEEFVKQILVAIIQTTQI